MKRQPSWKQFNKQHEETHCAPQFAALGVYTIEDGDNLVYMTPWSRVQRATTSHCSVTINKVKYGLQLHLSFTHACGPIVLGAGSNAQESSVRGSWMSGHVVRQRGCPALLKASQNLRSAGQHGATASTVTWHCNHKEVDIILGPGAKSNLRCRQCPSCTTRLSVSFQPAPRWFLLNHDWTCSEAAVISRRRVLYKGSCLATATCARHAKCGSWQPG